jgi:hypothetical protein
MADTCLCAGRSGCYCALSRWHEYTCACCGVLQYILVWGEPPRRFVPCFGSLDACASACSRGLWILTADSLRMPRQMAHI